MIDLIFEPLCYGLMYVVIGAWRAIPLMIVVLLIEVTLRRKIAARFHCLLLSLVIVRLLCPVSVPSALSVQGHFDQFGESMFDRADSLFEDSESAFIPPPLKFDTFTFDDNGQSVTLPIIPEDATKEFCDEANAYVARLNAERETDKYTALESSEVNDMQSVSEYQQVSEEPVGDAQFGILVLDWETIVALSILTIWSLVASLLIIRSFATYLRFDRQLHGVQTHTDANLLSQLSSACRRFGVRRIPAVKEVDGLEVPAVFGLWKPTICLPPGTSETLSVSELDWVLSHELSHIKRHDAWLMTAATLARALHWFNPLMHLAYSQLRLYVEQAADDLVTNLSDRSPSEYGHVLLRYATQTNGVPAPAVGLLFVSSNKSLRRRLEMLNHNVKRNRLSARVFAVAAIAVVAMTGLTDAKPPEYHQLDTEEEWRPVQPAPSLAPHEPPAARGLMVEKSYDVTAVLEKLAEEEPSVDPKFLLMSLFQILNSQQPGLAATTNIESGMLTITQTAESHRMTELWLRSIQRSGLNRQITVSIRVLEADPAIASAIDWTRRSIMAVRETDNETDSLDAFVRTLNPETKVGFALQSNDASYRSRPMFAVKASEQQLKLLMQRAHQRSDCNMMFAPKVTAFNGQVFSVTDQTCRPFQTGIKTIEDEDRVRDEAIIEIVKSGWHFAIYVEADEHENVDIHSVLTESELKGVEQADLPFLKEQLSVQVPHVAKTSAGSHATLSKGESLIILSPHTYDPDDKPESPSARFYILTPQVIVDETEVEPVPVPFGTAPVPM